MKTLLLTGGVGFIGAHCVEGVLKNTDWNIVILDRLDTSGCIDRLTDTDIWGQSKNRIKFVHWDLKAELNDFVINEISQVDYIWHLAAGSHVDRSIKDPLGFFMDNAVGTTVLLNYARKLSGLEKFIYFSTDEVFGPALNGIDYKEGSRHNPGNPYASSKAAAEDQCIAFANTYKLPIVITNTMNVIGERQHPEKFIPIIIKKTLKKEKITVHNGSRYWIHARNVCSALLFITEKTSEFLTIDDETKGKFNIVGEIELTNEELVNKIFNLLGQTTDYEVVDAATSRPGHDKRYALDGSKLKSYGFSYPLSFEQSFDKMVKWIVDDKRSKWLYI